MKRIKLKCDGCGSNLNIDMNVKAIDCSICGSTLKVNKLGKEYYSKVLEDGLVYKSHVLPNLTLPQESSTQKSYGDQGPEIEKNENVLIGFLFMVVVILIILNYYLSRNPVFLISGAIIFLYLIFGKKQGPSDGNQKYNEKGVSDFDSEEEDYDMDEFVD